MNFTIIIGNLTRDPVLRSTQDGTSVCSFGVAVNRKKTKNNQDPGADFFDVSAWRELGENCNKYLSKGSRVAVVGRVSCRGFTRNDGSVGASMEIQANDVEFLSTKSEDAERNGGASREVDKESGMEKVDVPDSEMPF